MTLNGKRDRFVMDDFRACAKSAIMKRGRAEAIVEEVRSAVERWPEFAEAAQLAENIGEQIQKTHRVEFPDH